MRAGSGAEAHIDDAGFTYRMCVVVDILDAVQNAGVSEQCGYEDQVGPGGYSLVLGAVAKRGAAAGGSACHVGAVRLRGVIGEDRPHLGFSSVFRTIIVPRRSCSKSIHLVPHALHAKNGAGGVVKGGVTELESHVDNTHHHAAAIEALRQIQSQVDTVYSQIITDIVQQSGHLVSYINIGTNTRLHQFDKVFYRNHRRDKIAGGAAHRDTVCLQFLRGVTVGEFNDGGNLSQLNAIAGAELLFRRLSGGTVLEGVGLTA